MRHERIEPGSISGRRDIGHKLDLAYQVPARRDWRAGARRPGFIGV